jgi:hypothetical protein
MSTRLSPVVWGAVGLLMVVATVLPIYLALVERQSADAAAARLTPIDRLRNDILDQSFGRPGDPDLDLLYAQVNARHFSNELPPIAVRWEPRLAEIDALENDGGEHHGLFGARGDRAVILLRPSLRDDRPALIGALCHEMAHAYLFRGGEDSARHGPAFDAVLRRLALEGAFDGAFDGGRR